MQINVFKIDYQLENSTWTAYVAAQNADEATETLMKKVKNPKIYGRGHTGRVDAFSDQVMKDIIEKNTPKKKGPGRPKGSTTKKEEKPKEEEKKEEKPKIKIKSKIGA